MPTTSSALGESVNRIQVRFFKDGAFIRGSSKLEFPAPDAAVMPFSFFWRAPPWRGYFFCSSTVVPEGERRSDILLASFLPGFLMGPASLNKSWGHLCICFPSHRS